MRIKNTFIHKHTHTHTLQAFDTFNMFCHYIHSLRTKETVAMSFEVDSTTFHSHRGLQVEDEAAPHGGGLDWFAVHSMC